MKMTAKRKLELYRWLRRRAPCEFLLVKGSHSGLWRVRAAYRDEYGLVVDPRVRPFGEGKTQSEALDAALARASELTGHAFSWEQLELKAAIEGT